ncbi:MAG: PocR ligand-binding domain-containing protein [Desulfobacterales bacterium]
MTEKKKDAQWIARTDPSKYTMVVCEDITERKLAEEALCENESAVRKKLKSILEPEGDLGTLELGDIIDCDSLQSMMEDFYSLTNIGTAIVDLTGKILVAVGWQDVCVKFHRVHPDTLKNCIESDIILSNGVPAGTYKTYRCKNNMWEMATPIEIDGRHLGNIFLGQFFYENEIPDYDLFRNQARQYGFDEKEYLAGIDRVPRWSHETVNTAMAFCAKLAKMISSLSYSTIRLSRVLSKQEETMHKLGESEERLRLARMATNDVIWDWDIINDSQQWNESGAGVFGWTDIVKYPQTAGWWVKRVHPEDRQRIEKGFFAVVDNPAKNHWQDEYRFQKADGSYAQVMDRGYVLRSSQGRAIRMIGAMLDITKRIEAENAIRESEQKYRMLFEETLNPILVVDENKRYIDANKAALEFLECDREKLLNRNVWDFAPPDKSDNMKHDHAPFMRSRTVEREYVVHGAVKTLMLNVLPLEIKDKTVLYGIGQDITERKQAEKIIKTSLKEKETLLKEVHHRVKNNMQVISSLLNLQIRKNKDKQVKKALMDCQGRIGSMACAHEMLYNSPSLSVIICQDYISKLANNILQSYQTDLRRVKLTVDAKNITLGIQQASTLGLIINELLSNSLKYAFPKNMQGRIMIRLRMSEQKMMEFVFSDNGIGIPEELDWQNTKSLGLNLIVLLAENQLGGAVSLERREGSCFTIKFYRENNQPESLMK